MQQYMLQYVQQRHRLKLQLTSAKKSSEQTRRAARLASFSSILIHFACHF